MRRARFRIGVIGLASVFVLFGNATGAIAGPLGGVEITPDRTLATEVTRIVNEVRFDHGQHLLRRSAGLVHAARDHAVSMARNGFFSHRSLDGQSESHRLSAYYSGAVAEALLWSSGPVDAESIVELWLGSSTHRRVLLGTKRRAIGVAVVRAKDAPGVFGGGNVTVVVADLGDSA